MITRPIVRTLMLGTMIVAIVLSTGAAFAADSIKGQVALGGAPIAKATVTLWEASANAPRQLDQTKSRDDGRFEVHVKGAHGNGLLYLVAAGGVPKASKAGSDNPVVVLLSVLGRKPPQQVVVNEFTTVASAFTAARFIRGESISGNPLGLRIAAMNVPNLVNLQSGGWGAVIVDGLNLTRSTTLANFNTLASLVTYAGTSASSDWRSRFFRAATLSGGTTPSNTLGAMAGIARQPWAHSKDLFALFEEAYPQAKEGLPIQRCEKHRRRHREVRPRRFRTLSPGHGLHGCRGQRRRMGHGRDARPGLDNGFQRQDSRDGFAGPSSGERAGLSV
jgi:hypothetical protein